jgi:hypothetical protein
MKILSEVADKVIAAIFKIANKKELDRLNWII